MNTELTKAMLAGRRFRFGDVGKRPWTEHLVLAEDGGITGYQHVNEATWEILGDNLVFKSTTGAITSEFRSMTLDHDSVSFRTESPGESGKGRHLTEYSPFASVPGSVAIEHPLSDRPGHDVAVLVRSYKCDAKFHDLKRKLETNRSEFDLYSIVDQTHGKPDIPNDNVVWHSLSACKEIGLAYDREGLLYWCSDLPFYFALRELPHYKHYIMIEDDVDLMRDDAGFLNEIAVLLRGQPELDLAGLLFHKIGAGHTWHRACARVFPEWAIHYNYFPFVVLSKRAAAYLYGQRLLEVARKTPADDVMNCEGFAATALVAGSFNCVDLNQLRPGSYTFAGMGMQLGDTKVGRPMNYDVSPELTGPVEMVHPVFTAEEYAERVYKKLFLARPNDRAAFTAELASPWAATLPPGIKQQLQAGRRPVATRSRKRKIVFVGNCQARRLQELYRDRLAVLNDDTTECVVSYEPFTERVVELIQSADVVVAQAVDSSMSVDVTRIDVPGKTIWYPNISGIMLWPYGGRPHVHNKGLPYFHDGPYGHEFGDRWLNRKIAAGEPVDDVVEQYLNLDIAKQTDLDRIYDLHRQSARQRDARTGFSIEPIIDRYFREERLFLTPANLELRLFNPLARGVYEQLGVPSAEVERVLESLWRTVVPPLELPVHPSVARHFGLKFMTPDKLWYTPGGERISFAEWARRYFLYQWNDDLLRGIDAAYRIRQPGEEADAALAQLRRGLDGTSGSAEAYECIARLLAMKGDQDGAFEATRRAEGFEPDSPVHRCNVAYYLARTGALADAEDHIEPVTRQWPTYVDGWVRIARIRGQRDDGPGAMDAIGRAVALAPRDPEALAQQIFLAEKYAGAEEQLSIFRAASVVAAKHAKLAGQLADQWARLRHFPEATEMYRVAIESDGGNASLFARFADALWLSGDNQGAAAALHRAIELDPGIPRYHTQLAHMLLDRGDLNGADEVLANAVHRFPPAADVLHLRALLFIRLERLDAALEAAEGAAALDQKDPHIAGRHAHILMQLGNYAAAERILNETIAAHPDLAGLHGMLGELLLRQKRRDEAKRAFNEALRSAPNHEGYRAKLKQLVEA